MGSVANLMFSLRIGIGYDAARRGNDRPGQVYKHAGEYHAGKWAKTDL
jgi:hypothetical protein